MLERRARHWNFELVCSTYQQLAKAAGAVLLQPRSIRRQTANIEPNDTLELRCTDHHEQHTLSKRVSGVRVAEIGDNLGELMQREYAPMSEGKSYMASLQELFNRSGEHSSDYVVVVDFAPANSYK